mmetsp:Transcript_8537/g.13179  ORF Transcript_8537/g.13179 Transcript_8537/m.13179 type:complete len:221 (-) Transcript_8537:2795-3457(-)
MEEFNPFDIKEKWLKFFSQSQNRVEITTEVALKNELTRGLFEFIDENWYSFTDREKAIALGVMYRSNRLPIAISRNKINRWIFTAIDSGRFDFTSGSTLALLADTYGKALDAIFMYNTNSDALIDLCNERHRSEGDLQMRPLNEQKPRELFSQISQTFYRLTPYYRYFFEFYLPNKCNVILDQYQRTRVYDPALFQHFVRRVSRTIEQGHAEAVAYYAKR